MNFFFLSIFLIGFQNSFSQTGEAAKAQMDSLLCLPMIAQVAQVAHDGGPMSYKLPVFSENIDPRALSYLDLVKSKKMEPQSIEIQNTAITLYAEIAAIRPDLAKACSEFATIVTGHCLSESDAAACLNQRGLTAETVEAAKKFAIQVKDMIIVKTEMKAATDLIMPIIEKQEAVKANFAQFVANNYIKIVLALWLFIAGMAVFGLRRFFRNR